MSGSAPLVVIGIPSFGTVPSAWVMARQALQIPLGAATSDQWVLGGELNIAEKRNAVVRAAFALNADYVLFLGDDTLVPPHTFIQLWQQMQRHPEAAVITGMYFSRSHPPQPMIWRGYMRGSYYDWHVGEFFQVDWAGCDCMLVRVSALRQIQEPWFSLDYVFQPDQPKPIALNTEDIYFYEKIRAHGFSAYCDAGVQCIHQDRTSGQQFFLPPDWPQNRPGSVIPDCDDNYLIADLGAGIDSPYAGNGRLVRFDLDESVSPDVRCDLRAIPEPDCKYDEVWSRHVLEHFGGREAPRLIQEWARILKIGGKFRLAVPNLELALRALLAGQEQDQPVPEFHYWQIWGSQGQSYGTETAPELDTHKNGFTRRTLAKLVEYAWGDSPIHAVDVDGNEADGLGCFNDIEVVEAGPNLEVTAVKVRHPKPAVLGPNGRFAARVRALYQGAPADELARTAAEPDPLLAEADRLLAQPAPSVADTVPLASLSRTITLNGDGRVQEYPVPTTPPPLPEEVSSP